MVDEVGTAATINKFRRLIRIGQTELSASFACGKIFSSAANNRGETQALQPLR